VRPLWLAACAVPVLLASLTVATPTTAATRAPADPAVIAEWNTIATTTLLGDPSQDVPW
jgi:hypothetical protein